MSETIIMKIEGISLRAQLNESNAARLFLKMLPLKVTMERWGDEYYGDCGIRDSVAPDARVDMEVGEIAIWPPGNALCIFFGPTPVSTGKKPRAASEVNPIGNLIDDPAPLKKLRRNVKVSIEASSSKGV